MLSSKIIRNIIKQAIFRRIGLDYNQLRKPILDDLTAEKDGVVQGLAYSDLLKTIKSLIHSGLGQVRLARNLHRFVPLGHRTHQCHRLARHLQ